MPVSGSAVPVVMRDGTALAVDVWLPEGAEAAGRRVGTVLRATRYWRAAVDAADDSATSGEVALFTGFGLALVTVDVRGTGASRGRWDGPWSDTELADLAEVVDWVVAQPWSNGRVGAHGVSYDGNTAEMLASLGSPHVRAVSPRFADYDPWAHLSFPGGVLLEDFVARWTAETRALDLDDPAVAVSSAEEAAELREWIGHPRPLDDDVDGRMMRAALRDHLGNVDLWDAASRLVDYDDEASQRLGYPGSAPFARRGGVDGTTVAMRPVGSWYDAGTAAGVLARFRSTAAPQYAVIGAWSHGGGFDADPFLDEPGEARPPLDQQRIDLAAWLAERLGEDDAPTTTPTLTYVTVGSGAWRTTTQWPPPGVTAHRLHLAADGALLAGPPALGATAYDVDPAASTGPSNRWHTQAGQAPVHYGDRAQADTACATWTGEPLAAPLTVTGTPVLHLVMSTTAADGAVHAYLEAVSPEGRVVYLTEGVLRLRHRATGPAPYVVDGPYHPCTGSLAQPMHPGAAEPVELALLPLSAQVPAGWSLRLALAGADAGTFRGVALDEPATWTVHHGENGSWLDLPIEAQP